MLDPTELQQLTRLYPVLGQLSPAVRTAVQTDAQRFAFPEGRILFEMESRCTSFVLLVSGRIRVTKQTAGGREILLYRLQPGDSCILTVSCLLGQADYPARGIAETDLAGYAISLPLFNRLLAESDAFRAFIFHFFAERIIHLMLLLEDVAFGQLDQRLAALLLDRGNTIYTTHQALADELGSVREVVSRRLKDFEGRSWVQLERGRIRIIDRPALQQVAAALRDSSH
jgi:CRP/FNR family transcriptional regulator